MPDMLFSMPAIYAAIGLLCHRLIISQLYHRHERRVITLRLILRFIATVRRSCSVCHFRCPLSTTLLLNLRFELRTHHLANTRNDIVLLFEIDETNALSVSALETALLDRETYCDARLIYNHQIMLV